VNLGLATSSTERLPVSETDALHGLDILVVDDNAASRRILNEMLLGWQMKPVLADCGETALEILHERAENRNPFALVLLDAQMPGMDGLTLSRQIEQDPTSAGPRIMMVGSLDLKSLNRDLGEYSHYVTKPVTQANLLKAVLNALGKGPNLLMPARNVSWSTAERPLRILLAEDNVINRKVAVRLLERQGHSVVVACDGKEALVAFAREPFDVILMDVQMPELNGYDATRAIREQEQESGRHVSIIALTAHAMKGDREICLNAGMDDYLSRSFQKYANVFWTVT